jgi:mannosyl-oligosaccharide alpha-1,3-glucosidase
MNLDLPDTIKEGTFLTEPYRLYNLDVFRFNLNNPMGLYGSIPFMMAVGRHGAFGIFLNNPSETFIDIERYVRFFFIEFLQGSSNFHSLDGGNWFT